jgi:hypothetical protein
MAVASMMLSWAAAEERGLEERFRNPPPSDGGCSVTIRLDPSQGDTVETVSCRLERLRELGVGGILAEMPVADEAAWKLLEATGSWCLKNRVELGVCDFWLSAEEASATPCVQKLVWSSRQVDGAALATNLLPWVYGPSETYHEVARLGVPAEGPFLSHQVVDLTKGAPSSSDAWRVFWFGHADREPRTPDPYQDTVIFRHVNQALVALQNRMEKSYGTAFLWYQCAAVNTDEGVWPCDIEAMFLKQGGLSLTRHLPVLAGVPVGGESAASHVRQLLATVLREAWRVRYAANVSDLVHESGLEAGIALGAAPIEPDEVALYFRRPTLTVARNEEQRMRNVRAAGAARTMARRFIVGRMDPCSVVKTSASVLLPFPFKHEMDGLFGDGVTRLLVELGAARLSDDKAFALMKQACLYAQRCQLLLQQGEPVADVLVWTHRVSQVLDGFSCDYIGQKMAESALVKGGRILFDSGRSYGAVAVSSDVLSREPSAERWVRQLAGKGLKIWLFEDGGAPEEAVTKGLTESGRSIVNGLKKSDDLDVVPDFLWRSEEEGLQVRFLHRRNSDRDVYFVMNGGVCGGLITCTFRDTGKGEPERWDPLTGEIGTVQETEKLADGRVKAPLYLGPHDSCFIVFGH